MSATLWIHVLAGRKIMSNEADHSALYTLADDLDQQCGELAVEKLSSFFDSTDLKYNFEAEEDEEDEEPELDPETGWAYRIDDMQWFDANDGLKTLQALLQAVRSSPKIPRLKSRQKELLEELQDCICQLEPGEAKGHKFHLAIVM